MINELEIFKNSNNRPNRIKSEWLAKDNLKCSFDLQLGLGEKIHWPSSNPIPLTQLIQLINEVSSWPRKDIHLTLKHHQFNEVEFETKNKSDKIVITSQDRLLFSGNIPHSKIHELKLNILALISECQKEVRNKYAEIMFKSENLKPENPRFLFGDKVSTIIGPNTKTLKVGFIKQIIQKNTGTKYTLLVNGLSDQREYTLEELELNE